MTWTSVSPIGTQSVRANRTTMAANTVYIETKMGNSVVGSDSVTVRDHFWNVDANLDGRHRFIQSPAFTVGAVPADPTLGTDMNSVMYTRFKTATESTFQQDVQAYLRNVTPNIMQILGIRACGVFNGSAGNPSQANVVYSHNLALQAAGTPGIVRNAEGEYTITFGNALPSANYLVVGGAIRNDSSGTTKDLGLYLRNSNTLTNVKSTTFVKINFQTISNSRYDPLQGWFVCFGG